MRWVAAEQKVPQAQERTWNENARTTGRDNKHKAMNHTHRISLPARFPIFSVPRVTVQCEVKYCFYEVDMLLDITIRNSARLYQADPRELIYGPPGVLEGWPWGLLRAMDETTRLVLTVNSPCLSPIYPRADTRAHVSCSGTGRSEGARRLSCSHYSGRP